MGMQVLFLQTHLKKYFQGNIQNAHMIKLKIKTSKLTESDPSGKINNFGVYAQSGDVINYILVDMDSLSSLVEKNRSEPGMPISSKLLTKDALFGAGVVAGGLELGKASEQLSGPCMDGYNVNGSVMNPKFAGQGLGKWLYKLAMGYIGNPIIPDRSNVSVSAQRVWNSLNKDTSVKKDFKVDYYGDSDTPKKFKISKLDTEDETPPPIDDCVPTKTKDAPDFLNKAYQTNKHASENKKLMNKLTKYVQKNITEPSAFYDNLIKANFKLFSTRLKAQ